MPSTREYVTKIYFLVSNYDNFLIKKIILIFKLIKILRDMKLLNYINKSIYKN